MDYNATLTFTPADGVDDDELVDRLVDYHPAVGPSDLVPGAREAVITLPAASLSQAITTVRAVAAPLGVLHGLEIVPTAAWDRRLSSCCLVPWALSSRVLPGRCSCWPSSTRSSGLLSGCWPQPSLGLSSRQCSSYRSSSRLRCFSVACSSRRSNSQTYWRP